MGQRLGTEGAVPSAHRTQSDDREHPQMHDDENYTFLTRTSKDKRALNSVGPMAGDRAHG